MFIEDRNRINSLSSESGPGGAPGNDAAPGATGTSGGSAGGAGGGPVVAPVIQSLTSSTSNSGASRSVNKKTEGSTSSDAEERIDTREDTSVNKSHRLPTKLGKGTLKEFTSSINRPMSIVRGNSDLCTRLAKKKVTLRHSLETTSPSNNSVTLDSVQLDTTRRCGSAGTSRSQSLLLQASARLSGSAIITPAIRVDSIETVVAPPQVSSIETNGSSTCASNTISTGVEPAHSSVSSLCSSSASTCTPPNEVQSNPLPSALISNTLQSTVSSSSSSQLASQTDCDHFCNLSTAKSLVTCPSVPASVTHFAAIISSHVDTSSQQPYLHATILEEERIPSPTSLNAEESVNGAPVPTHPPSGSCSNRSTCIDQANQLSHRTLPLSLPLDEPPVSSAVFSTCNQMPLPRAKSPPSQFSTVSTPVSASYQLHHPHTAHHYPFYRQSQPVSQSQSNTKMQTSDCGTQEHHLHH